MRRGGLSSPCFYEKRRAVKPVLARFSQASNSFPLKAVFVFVPSQNERSAKSMPVFLGFLPRLSRSSSSFALTRDALSSRYVRVFFSGIDLLLSQGSLRLFSLRATPPPSPTLSSVSSFGVPLGLVVHPSMAVSTHRLVRRPMMVWERGGRFYKSWVRCRPKWVVCSSPRGST